MKHLLEYIQSNITKQRYSFSDMIGDIIFELDESSISLLNPDFVNIITEEKYQQDKRHKGRIVWKSKDDDTLKLTSHARDREDRPEEKGGDGEHINEEEIVNMFIYAWQDIMSMFYEGYLKKDSYGNNAWVIQCRCYLEGSENNLIVKGARPSDKNLWAIWKIEENYNTGKIDITIITIYRGERINHRANQRRIVIANNGYVKQILPRN